MAGTGSEGVASGERSSPSLLVLRVLLPFAGGYFLSYLYRSVNAVLGAEIAGTIALEAADIGLMTSVYFVTFGAFQLPLGVLLDRFGPRRVEALLLLLAAAGAATVARADGVAALVAGRALVGLGVSACLMAPLKANVQFFSSRRLPLVNGVVLGAGGLGAVAATAPVHAALAFTDWRGVYACLAGLTAVMAGLLWRVVPDGATVPGGSLADQLRAIGRIYADPGFHRIAPLTMASLGYFMAVQGLWLGPWLRDVAGLTAPEAAGALATTAAAMASGFLLIGAIAVRLERLGMPLATATGIGMAVFLALSLAMAAGRVPAPHLFGVLWGFFGAASTANYAVLTRRFDGHLAGRVNTSLNLLIFLAAFVIQWGVGAALGRFAKIDGHWPAEAWSLALGLPLLPYALALLWYLKPAKSA